VSGHHRGGAGWRRVSALIRNSGIQSVRMEPTPSQSAGSVPFDSTASLGPFNTTSVTEYGVESRQQDADECALMPLLSGLRVAPTTRDEFPRQERTPPRGCRPAPRLGCSDLRGLTRPTSMKGRALCRCL
jgi:hypothetical protein